jgi:hypothetical protein
LAFVVQGSLVVAYEGYNNKQNPYQHENRYVVMKVPPKVFPVLAEQRSDKADRVVVETVRRYANAQSWQRCQADDAIN